MTKTTEPASTTAQNQTLIFKPKLSISVLIFSEGKPCRFLLNLQCNLVRWILFPLYRLGN